MEKWSTVMRHRCEALTGRTRFNWSYDVHVDEGLDAAFDMALNAWAAIAVHLAGTTSDVRHCTPIGLKAATGLSSLPRPVRVRAQPLSAYLDAITMVTPRIHEVLPAHSTFATAMTDILRMHDRGIGLDATTETISCIMAQCRVLRDTRITFRYKADEQLIWDEVRRFTDQLDRANTTFKHNGVSLRADLDELSRLGNDMWPDGAITARAVHVFRNGGQTTVASRITALCSRIENEITRRATTLEVMRESCTELHHKFAALCVITSGGQPALRQRDNLGISHHRRYKASGFPREPIGMALTANAQADSWLAAITRSRDNLVATNIGLTAMTHQLTEMAEKAQAIRALTNATHQAAGTRDTRSATGGSPLVRANRPA